MSTEYKIETIADFAKVPDDRLEECLGEVMVMILDGRELKKGGLEVERVIWIDDGIPGVRGVNLLVGDQKEYIPNPHFDGHREP